MYIIGGQSVLGSYHDICQDYSYIQRVNDDVIIAVVADGVGSAKYSQYGSEKAVKKTVEYLVQVLKNCDMEKNSFDIANFLLVQISEAYKLALNELEVMASSNNCDVCEYATTLTTMLVYKEYIVWGHSGDGAIFYIDNTGMISELTQEQSGKYAGEVYSLGAGIEYWSFGISENIAMAYFLMTDGVLSYFKKVNRADNCDDIYKEFLNNAISNYNSEFMCMEYINYFLESETLKKYTTDDKTMAVIINKEKIDNEIEFYYVPNNVVAEINYQSERFAKNPIDEDIAKDRLIYKKRNMLTTVNYVAEFIKFKTYIAVSELDKSITTQRGLYDALSFAKDYIVGIKVLHKKVAAEIEVGEYQEDNEELCIYKTSNILGSIFYINEYKDYVELVLEIDTNTLKNYENIASILASYRYQIGNAVHKCIIKRRHEYKEEFSAENIDFIKDNDKEEILILEDVIREWIKKEVEENVEETNTENEGVGEADIEELDSKEIYINQNKIVDKKGSSILEKVRALFKENEDDKKHIVKGEDKLKILIEAEMLRADDLKEYCVQESISEQEIDNWRQACVEVLELYGQKKD